MRIAQIAPVWYPVPPRGYGGIERVVALLADGLVGRGHEVALYASGDSRTKARLISQFDPAPHPSELGDVWYATEHALGAHLDAAEYDVVHDHSGPVGPAMGALLAGSLDRPPAFVHTLHGPWTDRNRRFFGFLEGLVHLVAVSRHQREDNPSARYAGLVHNGLDLAEFPFVADKDDHVVYVGRAVHGKAPEVAIEVARRAGRELIMVVKKHEPAERDYWDARVAPHLGADVEVVENAEHDVKVDLVGRAHALVNPIRWPEPFGLVMIEAMACGTPVVTCPAGAAPELVDHGRTGLLAATVAELARAVGEVECCDPAACREHVAERFSAAAMVAGYERVYEAVRSRTS